MRPPGGRGRPPGDAAAGQTGNSGAEFAWRVHTAQESWAAKADVKASILLALEGGALFAVIAAHARGGFLTRLSGWSRAVEEIGIVALLLAAVAASIAIFPRLGPAKSHRSHRHAIYFGTLRHWHPADLKDHLARLSPDEELDALSRQLIDMAKQNWSKHRWVQLSLALSQVGILMIAVAAVALL